MNLMKRLTAVLLALLLMLSLSVSALAEEAQAADYTTGTPWPDETSVPERKEAAVC